MSKKDDINRLYDVSAVLGKVNNILFFVNMILSFLSLVCETKAEEVFTTIQICLSALFVILTLINECWLWYDAECARRKGNIQDAFGIKLQQLKTDGYYNNQFSPSLLKYAVNTFESNFFSKEIALKMLPRKTAVSFAAGISFFISSRYIADGDLLLTISQVVFSSYFILDTIVLLSYAIRLKYWYDKAYEQLITIGIKNKQQLVWLMYYIVEYECVKAYFKVRLDSKIFNKYNLALTKEWDSLKQSINYYEDSRYIVV